ncbi:ankyrin repeat domain-containing protein [Occultella glacieicola]|uniref:Ankyrin repeat domain-containing protein n=1 Tax=Occultella glacieicola TaxID=2518684 RepID=A0ABY2E848_9MICO|nr:ankyrin repeat domain-containing protein [Occultella glacieicola]TDE98684.1 ankyrin repeat domain-containing protein [Occultella glacieicola]
MTSVWNWQGVLDRGDLKDTYVAKVDRLADAARDGQWEAVFRLSDELDLGVNVWRVGGESLYTPLHQAAWHGAGTTVVERLLSLGAWRTLRTAAGENAHDIARRRGHAHLLESLAPTERSLGRLDELTALDTRLRDLVESRIRPHIGTRLRFPQTSVLTEVKDTMLRQRMGFPVPGMYGGFEITLVTAGLRVVSSSRVAGGSGQEHLVTRDGVLLIDEGFV